MQCHQRAFLSLPDTSTSYPNSALLARSFITVCDLLVVGAGCPGKPSREFDFVFSMIRTALFISVILLILLDKTYIKLVKIVGLLF